MIQGHLWYFSDKLHVFLMCDKSDIDVGKHAVLHVSIILFDLLCP